MGKGEEGDGEGGVTAKIGEEEGMERGLRNFEL